MMKKSQIKKRLTDLFSEWKCLKFGIDLQIKTSGKINPVTEMSRKRVDHEISYWSKRWRNYQPHARVDPWKGDGRYVCHVDIPEEIES